MAKSSRYTKFEISSAPGTPVDISKYFRGAVIVYSDGSTEIIQPEAYLKELDEKYAKILNDIVTESNK